MYILAVDTSSKTASVALLKDDMVVGEYFTNTGFQHSSTLMPMIHSLFECSKVLPKDIDLYAVTIGPGSFTGVRIGVSAVKGMAYAYGKPCVEISPLEAMAMNIGDFNGVLCPTMDARCNQVYNALFRCENGEITRLCEDRAIKIDVLVEELKTQNQKVCFLGDGAKLCVKEADDKKLEHFVPNDNILYPKASAVGILGLKKYNVGETVSAEALSPLYLRPPQAERMKKENIERK